MFKLGSDKPGKTKGPKKKQLWGRDFDIVADGLDEKQVVRFVDDLMKQIGVSNYCCKAPDHCNGSANCCF